MQKSFQFNVAAFCLVLFSNTVLAAGIKPRRLEPSSIPGFPIATGTFSPKKPTFVLAPRPTERGPREVFENSKKLPGSFGSPQIELSKGNITSAKVSCIQDAIQNGDEIPTDDSSVWEFATDDGKPINSLVRKPSARSIKLPSAFAENSCDESGQRKSCVALLSKSISETPQAYYNSTIQGDASTWTEVGAFLGVASDFNNDEPKDINESLIEAEAKAQKEGKIDPSQSVQGLTGQDPLLVATQLLIQKIDESLARGNRDIALRGQALLKKINPSAAHALSCLGIFKPELMTESRLDDQKGSGIGPISGMDYGKLHELATHSNPAMIGAIAAVAGTTIVAVTYITSVINHWNDSNKADAARKEDIARADRAALDQRIKDYMACKGPACAGLYPDAAAAVKAATPVPAAPAQGSTPTREDPGAAAPIDMFAPSIPPKPQHGSGGGAGELNPLDLDNSKTTPFGIRPRNPNDARREDPEAAARFCTQVVNKYKQFKNHKNQFSGRRVDKEDTSSPPIPSGLGIAKFDEWDTNFWADRKSHNGFGSENNNCNSMDKVEGL